MREMLKEFEEKPKETEEADSEDRLTMALMSGKERRAKKKSIMKARMADMTRNEKIKYIVYYYKWHFFLTVAAILIFSALAITIYKNSRPVSLSAAVLNPEDSISLSDKPFKEFVKDAKLDKGHRLLADAYYNVTLEYELAKNSDISSVTSLSMLVKDDYYDVIITNLAGLEYCNYACLLFFMDDYFDQEVLDTYKDKIYYSSDFGDPENAKAAINAKTTEVLMAVGDRSKPIAVNISGTEFAKKLKLGYDDVYICFPGGKDRNKDRALKLLEYIFR